jgi:hypothetical protein
MKKIAIVILGVFFIALTVNAFAGDFASDLKGAFKSTVSTVYQATGNVPVIGSAVQGIQRSLYNTHVVAPYNYINSVCKIYSGAGINQHVNNAYNSALGIGNTITSPIVTALKVPYNAGCGFDAWYHTTMAAGEKAWTDYNANQPTISLVDGHWDYPNGTTVSAEEAGVNPSVGLVLGLRKIRTALWGSEETRPSRIGTPLSRWDSTMSKDARKIGTVRTEYGEVSIMMNPIPASPLRLNKSAMVLPNRNSIQLP